MSRAILYDSTLCIGCKACEGACAERWGLPYDDKIAAEEKISAHKLTAIETHGRPWAREMDAVLHRERVGRSRRQVTGVMIRAAAGIGLLIGGQLWPWSPAGYGAAEGAGVSGPVEVLTPPAIIAA